MMNDKMMNDRHTPGQCASDNYFSVDSNLLPSDPNIAIAGLWFRRYPFVPRNYEDLYPTIGYTPTATDNIARTTSTENDETTGSWMITRSNSTSSSSSSSNSTTSVPMITGSNTSSSTVVPNNSAGQLVLPQGDDQQLTSNFSFCGRKYEVVIIFRHKPP
ncbi:unnamed protein product [Amoebophrya sp. A25]|nr:unnamed protein product [Amoebophrya sp. A25]|eukprot:GSA25T00012574001.1